MSFSGYFFKASFLFTLEFRVSEVIWVGELLSYSEIAPSQWLGIFGAWFFWVKETQGVCVCLNLWW